MRRYWLAAAGAAFVLIAVAAGLAAREWNAGTGPRATGSMPSGDSREIAFVANAVAGMITVYDLAAREVIGTIDAIPDGRKVGFFRNPLQTLSGQPRSEASGGLNFAQDTDVSPDGRVLYVSRGNLADVAAFDLATGAMMWRRAVGLGRSDHMAISPDGRHLFVSVLAAAKVKRIDTRSGRIDGEFATGVFPHDNQVSPDGRRIYNASLGDMRLPEAARASAADDEGNTPHQITVADAASLRVLDRLKFTRGIRPFHLTHDGRTLFAQLSNRHDVVEYDIGAKRIVRTLRLPVAAGVTADDWDFEAPHHGLAMSPDGRTLCIAGRASDYAAIVSTRPLALVATVPVPDAPSWAVIDRAGRFCLTASTRADQVSIVSLADRTEAGRFATDRGPKHITMARVPVEIVDAIKKRPR